MDEHRTRGIQMIAGAALAAVLAGSAYAWIGRDHRGAPMTVALADDVLAYVDEQPISRADVVDEIETLLGGQLASLPPAQRAAIQDQLVDKVLDTVIVKSLLTRAVDSEGIAVEAGEMKAALDEVTAAVPPGTSLQEHLAAVGSSEKDLRDQITLSLRIKKLLDREAATAEEPTPQEIWAAYNDHPEEFQMPETVAARHILIATDATDSPEVKAEKKAKAEAARQRVMDDAGASFASVAAEVSDCPSKEAGGKIGPVRRGEIVPEFEAAAFSQKVGDIGPIVETRFGYHVIEVLERTEPRSIPLSEARAGISERLRQEKERAAIDTFIDGLKADATIVYPNEHA
jgi:peptidyl-prolyl cis-trans isomerase C